MALVVSQQPRFFLVKKRNGISDGEIDMAFYKCDKKQNGGTGFKVDDVSGFTVASKKTVRKVTITWTDPDDFEIEGTVQAKWAGTIIVKKAYSEPTSSGDGTVLVNSTVKNQYAVSGFEDSDVLYNTQYYYRAFPYTTDGVITSGSSASAEISETIICGVEWDGTADGRWTRTDDSADFVDPNPYYSGMATAPSSPFDDIFPWSGVKIHRTSIYGVGEVIEIPKYYYKWTRDGSKMKLQISNAQQDGFLVSPAHSDRGDGNGERNTVYLGRYLCANSTYQSRSGEGIAQNISLDDFRTNIHNLSDSAWQWDFAMYWTVAMLYLVEYADWNMRKTIGCGKTPSSMYATNGQTDSIEYHTGTTATSKEEEGYVKYRNIENLWSGKDTWIDGIYFEDENIYCIKNPSDFGDMTKGVLVGVRPEASYANKLVASFTNPENITGYEYALYPSEAIPADTDYSTYTCGMVIRGSSGNALNIMVGGKTRGFFTFEGSYPSQAEDSTISARLMIFIN